VLCLGALEGSVGTGIVGVFMGGLLEGDFVRSGYRLEVL
jgi:hypothetical protein